MNKSILITCNYVRKRVKINKKCLNQFLLKNQQVDYERIIN